MTVSPIVNTKKNNSGYFIMYGWMSLPTDSKFSNHKNVEIFLHELLEITWPFFYDELI